VRNDAMSPDAKKALKESIVFPSDKPKNIPKFWYPLTIGVITT